MILKRIRLHPFGGTLDREYDLARPICVVLGPNEAGKSTLRQAVHHALFTTTKQTDKQARAALGDWFPRPDGDHAAVTLVFEHDGVEWTLSKRWGAGRGSSLAAAGSAAVGDAAAVQEKLAAILGHNEATGRIVLSTGQAELARTVAALEDATSNSEIQPVADLLARGAAGAAGGIGPERLRAALEQRIVDHFGRWDRGRDRPMMDAGRERGFADPWRRDAGTIVKAWYAWQEKLDELRGLREAEAQLDAVSAELAALEAEMAADAAFLGRGGPLRDGLGRRGIIEAGLAGLAAKRSALAEAMKGWPAAVAGSDAAKSQLDDLQKRRQAIVAEQADAGRRAEAERKRAEFAAIVAARQEWLSAVRAVAESFQPPPQAVAALEQVAERIKDARNRIEAQKLAYEIAATEPLSIRIEEAGQPPRDVPVEGTVSGAARSRLRVAAGPLTITVTSGEEDVAGLLAGLERDTAGERELLAACRGGTLVEVKALVRRHDDLVATASRRQAAWESLLRGRAFAQWEGEIAALAELPQTRDTATLAAELAAVDSAIGVQTGELRLHEENVRRWTETHRTQEQLLESLVELQATVQRSGEELASLPTVPEGYATADDFLRELSRREADNRARPARLKEIATRQQQLRDQVGDRSATELAEETERLERAFERTRAAGRAYERILAALEAVVGEQKNDPLAGFAARVTESFRRITGGREELTFDDHLPMQVTRGAVALPPDRLSQGGGSGLALALRLALAEVHLGETPGFVVLDDPFVDLDAGRRERAKDLLRQFAARHQVILLTCHEPHATGLGEPIVVGGD